MAAAMKTESTFCIYIIINKQSHDFISWKLGQITTRKVFIDHELNSPEGLVQFGLLLKNLLMLIFF